MGAHLRSRFDSGLRIAADTPIPLRTMNDPNEDSFRSMRF
jgi:hypothetical protein